MIARIPAVIGVALICCGVFEYLRYPTKWQGKISFQLCLVGALCVLAGELAR